MVRPITASGVFMKLIILILSFGLFSCTTTEGLKGNMGNYQRNDLFDDPSLPTSASTLKSQTFAEAFDSASVSEQRGDLDKALFYYIQSLQFDPENADVLLKIAQIHEQRGNLTVAARAYSEALKNDPTLLLAYQGLGIISMEQRKYQQAREYLKKAVSLDQNRLAQQGAKKEEGDYVLDKKSPTKPYNVLGIIEDMDRHFDLARTYYNLALNANENSANILSNIGYSYYLTGELAAAERYFRRAINVDLKFKRAWTNLSLVYIRQGQYNRAVKTLKQVMEEFEAYNDLGYFLMLDGRLEDAEYFFQKAINMSPTYFKKAYSNLEQVQIKRRELWLLENEAKGEEVAGLAPGMDFDSTRSGISPENNK